MRVAPWFLVFPGLLVSCGEGPESLLPFRPRLVANQQELRFPASDVGVPVTLTATFSNPGDGEVRLQAFVDPPDAPVLLLETTGVARSGSPANLRIQLTPREPGPITATLRVQHDAEADTNGNRSLSVALVGEGNPYPDCDDNNPCTMDSRDVTAPSGCIHIPVRIACDDNDACTEEDMCEAGACLGRPIPCDDGIGCTADRCDATLGCMHEPTAALCDDGDGCTTDSCEPDIATGLSGCRYQVAPNGSLCGEPSCSTLGVCIGGECQVGPAPDGYPCEDGDQCTRGDACQSGACVPGPNPGVALGAPVKVRSVSITTNGAPPPEPAPADAGPNSQPQAPPDEEPPPPPNFTEPLFGFWPATLDGIGFKEVNDPSGTPPGVLLLWRGTSAYTSVNCVHRVDSCVAPRTCAPGAVDLSLHLSFATDDGVAHSDHPLLLGQLHERLTTQAGFTALPNNAPPATVAAAVGVPLPHNAMGAAAIIHYASACECGGLGPEVPPWNNGDAAEGAPIPDCLGQGSALAVLHATEYGLEVMDSVWLASPVPYSSPDILPVEGDDGQPLLAVASDGAQLAVLMVVRNEVLDVDCADSDLTCGQPMELRVHGYRVDTTGVQQLPLTPTYTQSVPLNAPWTGASPIAGLRAALVEGNLVVTWLQREESQEPTCGALQEPSYRPYRLNLGITDDLEPSGPLSFASMGRDAIHHADGQGPVDVVWVHRQSPMQQACFVTDEFILRRNPQSVTMGFGFGDASQRVVSAGFGVVGGRTAVAAIPATGALEVMLAETDQLPSRRFSTAFAVEQETMFHPGAPISVHPRSGGLVVAAVADADIYRDSLPNSALAFASLQCGLSEP